MKNIVGVLAVVSCGLLSTVSMAAPPYSITSTFDGAPGATSHRLYRGCRSGESRVLVGNVASGQQLPNVIAAPGQYSFCVHGVNAAGEGPRSNIVVVDIADVVAPGSPSNFQITIQCAFLPDGVTPSCTFTVTNIP